MFIFMSTSDLYPFLISPDTKESGFHSIEERLVNLSVSATNAEAFYVMHHATRGDLAKRKFHGQISGLCITGSF
jgi:hypothetical protein